MKRASGVLNYNPCTFDNYRPSSIIKQIWSDSYPNWNDRNFKRIQLWSSLMPIIGFQYLRQCNRKKNIKITISKDLTRHGSPVMVMHRFDWQLSLYNNAMWQSISKVYALIVVKGSNNLRIKPCFDDINVRDIITHSA